MNTLHIFTDAYVKQFGEGSGQILLDDVECMGNENHLSQCPHNDIGVHNCMHFQDIGVQCLTGL